jgi:hypothetical protein
MTADTADARSLPSAGELQLPLFSSLPAVAGSSDGSSAVRDVRCARLHRSF